MNFEPVAARDLSRQNLHRSGNDIPLPGQELAELLKAMAPQGVTCRFEARGASMHPFVRDGDIVDIAAVSRLLPQVGRIAVFLHENSGRLFVHRVIGRIGVHLQTKGDNCAVLDPSFAVSDTLGIVTRVERGGRSRWFGNGPERVVIAWASRHGLLGRLFHRLFRASNCLQNRVCFIWRSVSDRKGPSHSGSQSREAQSKREE